MEPRTWHSFWNFDFHVYFVEFETKDIFRTSGQKFVSTWPSHRYMDKSQLRDPFFLSMIMPLWPGLNSTLQKNELWARSSPTWSPHRAEPHFAGIHKFPQTIFNSYEKPSQKSRVCPDLFKRCLLHIEVYDFGRWCPKSSRGCDGQLSANQCSRHRSGLASKEANLTLTSMVLEWNIPQTLFLGVINRCPHTLDLMVHISSPNAHVFWKTYKMWTPSKS